MQLTPPITIPSVRKAINENDLIAGTGLQSSGRTWSVRQQPGNVGAALVAMIANTGPNGTEPDYSDYHYWVLPQQNNTTLADGSYTDGANWNLSSQYVTGSSNDYSNGSNYVLTAVNPSEYNADFNQSTHSIAVGTIVSIAPVFIDASDGTAEPIIRWIILGTTAGGSLPVGQYQGQVYGMPSDNQSGFTDIFMVAGP